MDVLTDSPMDARTRLSLPSTEVEAEDDPRAFDPWRFAKSEKARSLVDDVAAIVDAYERAACPRERARRETDQATFEETLERIVLDVAHLQLSRVPGSRRRLQISRSKAYLCGPARYAAPARNGQLPKVLDLLVGAGLIEQTLGDRSKYRLVVTDEFGQLRDRRKTTIAPSGMLKRLLVEYGITFADIGYFSGGELIVLKEARKGRWHSPVAIDYEDDAVTNRLRSNMAKLNGWLSIARIICAEQYEGELCYIDLSDRCLRRVFTCGDFAHGGRLAGGFWMSLKRHLRLSRLRIDGEPVVSLDYSSMYPRLLYAREGVRPAMEDLYQLDGLEAYRRGMKRLLNARLFDLGPRKRKPKRTPQEIREGVQLFPPDRSIKELLSELTAAHEPIAHNFGTGVGHELQFVESTILMEVLRRLEGLGVSALPVHDCVVVPRSKSETARAVMRDASEAISGTAIPVSVEKVE